MLIRALARVLACNSLRGWNVQRKRRHVVHLYVASHSFSGIVSVGLRLMVALFLWSLPFLACAAGTYNSLSGQSSCQRTIWVG